MQSAGIGLLRFTILFGVMAVAIAMLIAPLAQDGANRVSFNGAGVDTMSTGSIRQTDRYTVRRSVLQPHVNSVCIIRPNGARSGSC
ncbi:hypothetical protein DUP91_27110 [Salmonella enterica subsp. enterica]|nr:hypothetical protein [Salmonella enterica subsp. enterica]